MGRRRLYAALLVLAAATLFILLLWDPDPRTTTSFNHGKNGLWLGHKWYTGVTVRSAIPVLPEEVTELTKKLTEYQIRYAFVHVGPAREDGSLSDSAGPILGTLRNAVPQVELFA